MLKVSVTPLSMISKDGFQQIELNYESERAMHLNLSVYDKSDIIASDIDVAFNSGTGCAIYYCRYRKTMSMPQRYLPIKTKQKF